MSALLASWWAWIAPLSVQLAALALPLWWLDRRWARSGRVALRTLLWSAVLLRVLWPGELGLLQWDAPAAARAALAAVTPAPSGTLFGLGAASVPGSASVPGASTAAGSASASVVLPALAALWALGALLGLHLHARSCRRTRRAWGPELASEGNALRDEVRALAARLGLRRVPRVVLHTALPHPLVDGVLRVTLRLPADFGERVTPTAREHILLHELAHVRRRDPLLAAAQGLLAQLLWFHPVARMALSRLHALREQACDELAARHAPGGRRAYRRTLLEAAALALLPRDAQPGLGLLGRRAPLIERLERLGRRPARVSLAAWPVLGAAALALLPLRTAEREAPREMLANSALTLESPIGSASITPQPLEVVTPTLAAPTPTLAAPAPGAPVPGAAVGCFDTRFLVMAELARQQAVDDTHPSRSSPSSPSSPSSRSSRSARSAHSALSAPASLTAHTARRSPNTPTFKDAQP